MAQENWRPGRPEGFRLSDLANFQVPAVVQARFPHGVASVTQGFVPYFSPVNHHPPSHALLPESMRSQGVALHPSNGTLVIDMEHDSPEEMAMQQHMLPSVALADINQNSEGTAGHGNTHSHTGGDRPLDVRLFLEWIQKSGIFLILLFVKLMYEHSLGIIVFVALVGTFFYVNMTLVNYIHQNAVRQEASRCNIGIPLWLVVFLSTNIALMYYVFADQQLWRGLILQMPRVGSVDIWTLLWMVLLNDYVVKFATIIGKSLVSMLPYSCLPHQQRGKYYLFLETVSQCYRSFLTVVPWFHFLNNDQQTSRYFAWFATAVYLLFKGLGLLATLKGLLKAFQRLRVHSFVDSIAVGVLLFLPGLILHCNLLPPRGAYGTKPSRDDLKQRGEQCPICQDSFSEPVMLHCRHVFCEKCVSVWFDRERTCPMCRAQITENPQWQDGSTSAQLQWY